MKLEIPIPRNFIRIPRKEGVNNFHGNWNMEIQGIPRTSNFCMVKTLIRIPRNILLLSEEKS